MLKRVRVVHPELRTIVFSIHSEAHYVARCLKAGAWGYVCKAEEVSVLFNAVRCVAAGTMCFPHGGNVAIARSGRAAGAPSQAGPMAALSDRELEVISLLGSGRSPKQVAATLHLSGKTVETYMRRAKRKMNLGDTRDLVRYATLWESR